MNDDYGYRAKKYVSTWRSRLIQEYDGYGRCLFVTLTYDDEHLPVGNIPSKEDCVKFFKRLRKQLCYFKYFLVSEKGSETDRTHYHMLLFCDLPNNMSTKFFLEKIWKNGFVDVNNKCRRVVNRKCINYVTKYLFKRYDSGSGFFSLKSNGIGLSLLTKAMRNYFRRTKRLYYISEGKRIYLSRYLRNKVYPGLRLRVLRRVRKVCKDGIKRWRTVQQYRQRTSSTLSDRFRKEEYDLLERVGKERYRLHVDVPRYISNEKYFRFINHLTNEF